MDGRQKAAGLSKTAFYEEIFFFIRVFAFCQIIFAHLVPLHTLSRLHHSVFPYSVKNNLRKTSCSINPRFNHVGSLGPNILEYEGRSVR